MGRLVASHRLDRAAGLRVVAPARGERRRQDRPGGRRRARRLPPGPFVRRATARGVRRGRRRADGRDDPVPGPAVLGGRGDGLGTPALGLVGAPPDDAPRCQPATGAGARLPAGDRGLCLRHDHARRRPAGVPLRLRPAPRPGGAPAGPGLGGAPRTGGRDGLPARRPDRLGDRPERGGRRLGREALDRPAGPPGLDPADRRGARHDQPPDAVCLPGVVPTGRALARLGPRSQGVATAGRAASLHGGDAGHRRRTRQARTRCGGPFASSRSS